MTNKHARVYTQKCAHKHPPKFEEVIKIWWPTYNYVASMLTGSRVKGQRGNTNMMTWHCYWRSFSPSFFRVKVQ